MTIISNSSCAAISLVFTLIKQPIEFIEGDIRDAGSLKIVLATHQFLNVAYFAVLKAVDESVAKPLMYYNNNVSGTIALLEVMSKYNRPLAKVPFH